MYVRQCLKPPDNEILISEFNMEIINNIIFSCVTGKYRYVITCNILPNMSVTVRPPMNQELG